MHINSGYPDLALSLIRNHLAAFAGSDAVVVPSGTCTASIRHQHADVALVRCDDALARDVQQLAGITYELSASLLDVLGVEDVGAY
jgi:L-lactate dehydrogenase complex protein LldE